MPPVSEDSGEMTNLANDDVVERIRRLILAGTVLPGQPLRQAQLAEMLDVSRVPIREALSTLVADGVVVHERNLGFAVRRFNADELAQIYLARRLLETEVIKRIGAVPTPTVDRMEATNRAMRKSADRNDVPECSRLNREFHFTLFEQARLHVITEQLERLWNLSDFYRSLYYYDRTARSQAMDDHDAIVQLLRRDDRKGLLKVVSDHRRRGEDKLDEMLLGGRHPLVAV